MKKTYSLLICSILLFTPSSISVNAFNDWGIFKEGYIEYLSKKWIVSNNDIIDNIKKDNVIKIKTQFDFYKEEEMKEIIEKRNEILNSLRITWTVDKDLDTSISDLYVKITNDKDWFYITSFFEDWDILNLSNKLYYIEDYNVIGNVDVKNLIKEKILKDKQNNSNNVLDILDKYEIKYTPIKNLKFKLYVQHLDNPAYKEEIPITMVLNMEYPSAYLDTKYWNKKEKYFWTYVWKEELYKKIKMAKYANELYFKIWKKVIYLWKYWENVYETNLKEENWKYEYNINKNYNEYLYLLLLFLLWIFIWWILFKNFQLKLEQQVAIQPEEF